jgi:hypothetical protein
MILDALHRLSIGGFAIRDYQYTGMGSIAYVDFIMLHKYLGIDRLLSVEESSIPKRLEFNKPFGHVKWKIGSVGSVIPSLSRDIRHIVWLDYDTVLCSTHLSDINQAASHLPPGSLLLVTLDAGPPGPAESGPKEWMEYFGAQAPLYMPPSANVSDFALSNIPRMLRHLVNAAIKSGLTGRPEVTYRQLFDFEYADGHLMLSVGGMLCGPEDLTKLPGCGLSNAKYVRDDETKDPFVIRVPIITRKERLYLDSAMPCSEDWSPPDFELEPKEVAAYRAIYQFYPAYAELLL